jgi:hypothetical protein
MNVVPSDISSRIEFWIAQIERVALGAIAELEPAVTASRKRAEAVGKRRAQLQKVAEASGLPHDIAACERAFRHESRALEAAQPDAWFSARSALTHVECLRRALAKRSVEEAVEAAFQAINAAWRVTGEQLDPLLQSGITARKNAGRGGRARAERNRAEWKKRQEAIRKAHKQMMATGEQTPSQVRLALVERFGVSERTIDRALQTRTRHLSDSPGTLPSGSTEGIVAHEDQPQPGKVRKAPAGRVSARGHLSGRQRTSRSSG